MTHNVLTHTWVVKQPLKLQQIAKHDVDLNKNDCCPNCFPAHIRPDVLLLRSAHKQNTPVMPSRALLRKQS